MTKNEYEGAQWDDKLQCAIRKLEYDFGSDVAKLHFYEGHCCDMNGAIHFVTSRFPTAEKILTFSGRDRDVMYWKDGGRNKGWSAYTQELAA